MKKQLLITIGIIFTTLFLKAQEKDLTIGADVRLPKDSLESSRLISSLTGFFSEVHKGNEKNQWVLPSEKSETAILIGRIQDIDNNRKSGLALKPCVNNVARINKEKYLIQVSYTEVKGSISQLIALFEIVATKTDRGFLFSSPLLWNTRHWKKVTDNYLTFYYNTNNRKLCDQYIKYINEFDKMLGNKPKPQTVFFCNDCDNLLQLLQLSGIQYHIDYNGLSWSMADFNTSSKMFAFYTSRLSNIQKADPHDIFHGRCSLSIPFKKQNRLMVCGSAYAYTGSWGYSWNEVKEIFKSNMSFDEKTDWLKLYFDKNEFNRKPKKKLYVTQFINALIILKIEKKHGFSAVKELLASGNMYKNREGFFKTLERVAEINETNFNEEVGKLINNAIKSI